MVGLGFLFAVLCLWFHSSLPPSGSGFRVYRVQGYNKAWGKGAQDVYAFWSGKRG